MEIASNLKRKDKVSKKLGLKLCGTIKNEFLNDIAKGKLKTSEITSSIIINAVQLIDKTYISIQLSSALELNNEYGDIVFICSDKQLSKLAKKTGLNTLFI